jgi:hypothetical protein
MKRFAAVIVLIITGFIARAQHTADIGVQVSGAGYWGDIDKVNYSKSITPVIGALGRWNFNKRLAVRGQLTTGNLKAIGEFGDAFMYTPNGTRNQSNLYVPQLSDSFTFKRSFQTVEALFEFNFFNYKMGSLKKEKFTPFVSLGVGCFFSRAPRTGTFILDPLTASTQTGPYFDQGHETNRTDALTLVIPVGMGVKFNITRNLGGIVEVIVRKTFADNIDNLDDPKRFQGIAAGAPNYANKFASGFGANNDWYATCSASLIYQLWKSKGNCKIYDKFK